MTDRTGSAIYRAICQKPECDTARLVFADWLEENGDESRAEFIRVQISLANPPWNSKDMIRSERLLTAHGAEWRACPCPNPIHGEPYSAKKGTTCRTCGGSGDLFRQIEPAHWSNENITTTCDRPVGDFERGFIPSVECTLAELGGECPECRGHGRYADCSEAECTSCGGKTGTGRCGTGFHPSDWAAAVVRESPVTRFVIPTDEPTREEGGWEWYELPDWLNTPATKATFATPDAAKDAIYRELGAVVRRAVYGVTTQPEWRR